MILEKFHYHNDGDPHHPEVTDFIDSNTLGAELRDRFKKKGKKKKKGNKCSFCPVVKIPTNMVHKLFCEICLSIQNMLGEKKREHLTIFGYTYIHKETFLPFIFFSF